MFLYNLTLQKGGGVQCAVYGNFSAPKAQEIVVSRNKVLELLRPDESGKMQTIVSTEVFGVIRSLAAFRLTGANRDYLVCGSDSGRIVVLQYDKERNRFDKVHQETFGKSGCRRIVPGQFLCVDPKGRAIMIAAIAPSSVRLPPPISSFILATLCRVIPRNRRRSARSEDSGETWTDHDIVEVLPDGHQHRSYGCMGGLVRLPVDGEDWLVFSNIDTPNPTRERITVWVSPDGKPINAQNKTN